MAVSHRRGVTVGRARAGGASEQVVLADLAGSGRARAGGGRALVADLAGEVLEVAEHSGRPWALVVGG
jgi:hypothetical protein